MPLAQLCVVPAAQIVCRLSFKEELIVAFSDVFDKNMAEYLAVSFIFQLEIIMPYLEERLRQFPRLKKAIIMLAVECLKCGVCSDSILSEFPSNIPVFAEVVLFCSLEKLAEPEAKKFISFGSSMISETDPWWQRAVCHAREIMEEFN